MQAESWAQPGLREPTAYAWTGPLGEPLGLEGCSQLPFTPSVEVSPEEHTASTPTGLDVDVRLPQAPLLEANPEGRAEADVRETTVTLPAGVQVSPSAANGLAACPETLQDGFEGVGFTGFQKFSGLEPAPGAATFTPTFRFTEEGGLAPSCPEASKVGTVRIRTPLLPDELEGYAYLAAQDQNPFGSLLALYIVAEDKKAGVLVKLAGEVALNEATGQITTSFKNTPQLPFEELKLQLFGGERASLSTPASCGSYTTSSVVHGVVGGGRRTVIRTVRSVRGYRRRRVPGRPARVLAGVQRAEHERAGGRVLAVHAGTRPPGRRAGADRRDGRAAARGRGAALERHAVSGTARPGWNGRAGRKPDRALDCVVGAGRRTGGARWGCVSDERL